MMILFLQYIVFMSFKTRFEIYNSNFTIIRVDSTFIYCFSIYLMILKSKFLYIPEVIFFCFSFFILSEVGSRTRKQMIECVVVLFFSIAPGTCITQNKLVSEST